MELDDGGHLDMSTDYLSFYSLLDAFIINFNIALKMTPRQHKAQQKLHISRYIYVIQNRSHSPRNILFNK